MTLARILILLIVSYSPQVYCNTMNQTNETDCPPALPPPVNLTLNNYTNSSVVLSWVPTTSDNHCIREYRIEIVSNISNYSQSINQTQITLDVPSEHPLSTKYCAMIATVSISNMIGDYTSEPICSTWDVPAPLSISYNMSDGNLIWKSKQGDRPPITDYYINLLDSSQQVIHSGDLPLNPTIVNLNQSMFSDIIAAIEIIAANVLGNNTGSQVNITQPSSSMASTTTTTMLSTSTTVTATSSSIKPESIASVTTTKIETTKLTAEPEPSTGMKTITSSRSSMSASTGTTTSTTMIHPSSIITPQSSRSSSVISTAIPSIVTSSSSIVPVIGGAVGGVVLLVIIIVVLVVIFFMIVTMKKKSKAYAIKTLEDEAVKIDNVNMYKEVGEHASNNRNRGSGSAMQSELPPSIPMRNVSLGSRATVDGSAANTHTETTQQKETSTVELPTYQDPKSIRREVTSSTGSIYTVHQKKARSTGGQPSTVSVPDYADLSLQARNTASRSQPNVKQSNDDYDDILSVSSNVPDRVDYADLSFQANDTASRQPNISPQPQSYEDYDDISSVIPPSNVPTNYADLSFNSSRPYQQPRPGNIEPVQYAEIHK